MHERGKLPRVASSKSEPTPPHSKPGCLTYSGHRILTACSRARELQMAWSRRARATNQMSSTQLTWVPCAGSHSILARRGAAICTESSGARRMRRTPLLVRLCTRTLARAVRVIRPPALPRSTSSSTPSSSSSKPTCGHNYGLIRGLGHTPELLSSISASTPSTYFGVHLGRGRGYTQGLGLGREGAVRMIGPPGRPCATSSSSLRSLGLGLLQQAGMHVCSGFEVFARARSAL